jgi:hypothetical protein
MQYFGGFTPLGWAVTLGFLCLGFLAVWRWCGSALPPASVVDEKYIGKASEPAQKDGSLSGGEYQGRIASTVMYQRTPFFETVRARAFAIESLIAIICWLVFVDSGATILNWSNTQIAAFPIPSYGFAVLCLVLALYVGAIRQLYGFLLSRAGALPVVDDRGRPKFAYVGDVPPIRWQYSPWYRAVTWILVTAPSLVGALILAGAADELLQGAFTPTLVAVLVVRWLISAVPRFRAGRQIGAGELQFVPADAQEASNPCSDDGLWEKHMEAAYVSRQSGDFAEAVSNLELARSEAEEFGDQDARLGMTLANLGWLRREQGRFDEAETLYKRSLDILEAALGPEDLALATSLDGLASIYEAQSRYSLQDPRQIFRGRTSFQESSCAL